MEIATTDASVGRPLGGGSAVGIQLRILGPFEAVIGDEVLDLGGPKQRAVLALLALEFPNGLGMDGLIDGIWGETAPEAAKSSVYSYVSNLRVVLGGGIDRRRGAYVLAPGVSTDVIDFEARLDRARALLPVDSSSAAADLRTALATWRGLPYADLREIPGLVDEARRLEAVRLLAVETRIEADLASGLSGELVGELEALTVAHPLRERFRAQLMIALYRSGRQAEALREYARIRDLLLEELGVDPSRELQDLELRILQQSEELSTSGQVTTERLAFLFTDIEGSTRLWNEHRAGMAAALALHDQILNDAVETAGGTVFKHTGDGAIAVFRDAGSAAAAAEDAQRALLAAEWSGLDGLRVRMAIDVGDVDVRDGDYFGPPLNRCARIVGATHGDQVVLSSSALDELSSGHHPGVQIKQLGTHRLRGLGAAERLAQLVFVGLPADFPDLVTDAPPSEIGERLEIGGLPGYELRERLGRSAWGSVYRAYQPAVGREVAVRVIASHLSNHPSFVRRFEAHARALADLEHPFIVPLYDFWRDFEGAYLVMQLMRGGSLDRELRGRPWEPEAAVTILRQLGSALAYAHGEGAVHGDIRPANVLLDGRGNAFLSDFGLSLDLDVDLPRRPAPKPYLAPEIGAGEQPSARSDVYSLALVGRAVLSGVVPADVPGPRSPQTGGLSDAVEAVLGRGAALDPSDRYPTVGDLVEGLESALGTGRPADGPPIRSGVRNPYKGLLPFAERDVADFHGRTELVDALVDAVERHRLVAVVGPSGSGKSSAVQAGLVPHLRTGAVPNSEDWFYASLTPGEHPMRALADALRPLAMVPLGDLEGRLLEPDGWARLVEELLPPPPGELVLVVDQFEELFTIAQPNEVEPFLRLLVDAVGDDARVRVVVTLRADFYDRPLQHRELGALFREGLVTVIPPTADELVQAVERPAHGVGLTFQPGLPMRIVGDVVGQPGGLPLVQYALTEMVERRSSDMLTGADYEAIGTVNGAVARAAEAVFARLDPEEQAVAGSVLLRLVIVDEETDDTRRRVRLGELEGLGHRPETVERVLDAFGRARLLSFDRDPSSRTPTVEVAHEALLREWERLRDWIDEEREALILARRLRLALSEWEQSGRSEAFLLTGDRLAPFRAWSRFDRLTRDEADFLGRSERVDQQARSTRRRRRRGVLLVLAGAALVAVVLAVFALAEGRRADEEAARAVDLAGQEVAARMEAEVQAGNAESAAADALEAEELAKARELAAAAIGVGSDDPQLAMLLALEAFALAPADATIPIELSVALREAIHENRLVEIVDLGIEEPGGIRVSPSGRWIAVDSWGTEELVLADSETLDVAWRLEGGQLRLIDFSPDEEQILLRTDETLELRSVSDGALIETIEVACAPHWAPDGGWSADGSLVAFASTECSAVVLLETDTWTEVHRIPLTDPEALMGIEFAREQGAHRLLVREWFTSRPALVVDTETFEEVVVIDDSLGALSPDGTLVVGVDYGDEPRLYDATSGDVIDRLDGMGAEPSTSSPTAFSPDGRWALVPTEGSMLPIWEVDSGELAFRIPAGQTAVAAFLPDDRLVTVPGDGQLWLWDLSGAATGELVSVGTGITFSMRGAWASEAVGAVVGLDAATEQRVVHAFDPADGSLLGSRPIDSVRWPWIGVLGRSVVLFELGPTGEERVVRWDPVSGDEARLVDCADETDWCTDGLLDHVGMWSSGDGSEFGYLSTDRTFRSWSADGSEGPVLDLAGGDSAPTEMLMSLSDGWVVVRQDWNLYEVFDRDGAMVEQIEVLDHPWLRFDRTGTFGMGWGFGDSVSLIDTSDWSVRLLTDDIGEGLVRGGSFSPSAQLLAVGIQGGPMRVFSVPDGELVARIPIDSVVSSYWIDEDHIAVATREGLWTVVTLDLDELRWIARDQIHRELTADECRTYRIESCSP